MRILGFDVSSNTIGYSVLETTNDLPKVIICSFFHPPKPDKGTYIERLKETRDKITEICREFSPNQIAVEEIVQFMKGSSGAKTIIALARFNACVGLTCYDYTNVSPTFYNVLTIRHAIKTSKKLPDKLEIPELLSKQLNFKFPYIYMKKKKDTIAKETYDAADSLAVAYCHYLKLQKSTIQK